MRREQVVAAEGKQRVVEIVVHKARHADLIHRSAPGAPGIPLGMAYLGGMNSPEHGAPRGRLEDEPLRYRNPHTGCAMDPAVKARSYCWVSADPDGSVRSPMRHGQKYARFKVTALAATLALMLAACGGGAPSPTPAAASSNSPSAMATSAPSTSPPTTTEPPTEPTPIIDPTIERAAADILDVYRAWWDARIQFMADPMHEPPELSYNSQDDALVGLREAADQYVYNGIITTGTPVISPVVSDVSFEASGSATIRDCVDVTNWLPVYAATGDSALAPNQLMRVVSISTAVIYAGRWVIGDATVYRETSC